MPETNLRARGADNGPGVGRACLCFNLRRGARSITRFYDRCLAPSGLRANQFSMLMAAKTKGPVTMTGLADIVAAERTTLTRNLGILERQGLIRTESGQDRRERLISITEKGLAALTRARPYWRRAQAAVEGLLGRENATELLRTLSALTDSLKAQGLDQEPAKEPAEEDV
jgi:DNA-binding MarR family transcriptional regulator